MDVITNYRNKIREIFILPVTNCENEDKVKSQKFNRTIKTMMQKLFPDCTIYPIPDCWCYADGFIEKDGKYVFYSFSDFRWWPWDKDILIRTATSLKDFTGGRNNYANLEDLQPSVYKLFNINF